MNMIYKSLITLSLTLGTSQVFSNEIPVSTETKLLSSEQNANEFEFVTLTFHDVRDDVAKKGDKDIYAISTENLAQYLNWIKREGWTPIRLEDIWNARMKNTGLPNKAVLLTFDDGALSSYTRVFPLLKQYGVPATFALPTSWINGNTKDGYEAYGQGNLMNWNQIREMQKSGLAEFVSHSDNLHRGILSNPQANMEPAAITREYFPQTNRYETDEEYDKRIVNDLKKSKQILDKELGINSKAIFWPYGAVNKEAEDLAAQAGLPMSFSLGSVVTKADAKKTYQRALVMNNPRPEEIHNEMRDFLTNTRSPYKQRKTFLRVDAADISSNSNDQSNEKLGQFLDRISGLKTNTMLLEVVGKPNADGKIEVAYFPNSQLKMQQDIVNRTVWQSKTRIGNRVYAELPISLQTKQNINLAALTGDLVKNNTSIEGLVLETGNELDCAIQNGNWSNECNAHVQNLMSIKDETKAKAKVYANISNSYQTIIKFAIKDSELEGLKNLVDEMQEHSEFVYLTIDPIANTNGFKSLIKQINTLSSSQRQALIVSFNVDESIEHQKWKTYSDAYQQLRKLEIQKIGIENYKLSNSENIQRELYKELSLNSSPLTFYDPYSKKKES
jgi:poly-beta-1,6-N-acetyl-D-glucosamine N-deacetylase